MKWLSIILSTSILFLACNKTKEAARQPGTTAALNIPADSSSTIDTVPKIPLSIKTFDGLLFTSKFANVLKTCNNKQSYSLIDEQKLVTSAYKKAVSNLSYPNESLYLKIEGYLKSTDTLVVTNLVDAKPKSFLTACFDYEFILLGTEPFWSVEIIPNEKIIALKDVSTEKSYVLPYSKPTINGNEYSYRSKNEKGDILEIVIRKENCNDGMSDRNYQYSSQITINGKPMSGCAVKKGDIF